jgi:hypothetical protein
LRLCELKNVTQSRKDAKGYKPEMLAGFDFVSRKDAKTQRGMGWNGLRGLI